MPSETSVIAGVLSTPQATHASVDRDDERRERLRQREEQERADQAGQRDPDRRRAPPAVGRAADDELDAALDRRRGEERRADHRAAGAERVEPQRREHLDRPDRERVRRDEPGADADARVAQRRREAPAGRRRARRAGAGARRTSPSTAASTPTAPNGSSGPVTRAIAPSTGPSRKPTTAAPIAPPIVVPRRSGGVVATSQPIPPAQEQRGAEPEQEARGVQHRRSSARRRSPGPASALSASPARSVRRAPMRAASHALGAAPSIAPAA